MRKDDIMKDVHKLVCSKMMVDYSKTFSTSRKSEYVLARQVTMSLLKKHFDFTYESIGDFFNQHFGIAMRAKKVIANMYFTDSNFMSKYDDIEVKIISKSESIKKDFKKELKDMIKEYVNSEKHQEISDLIDIL